jgi:hypothetical protein
MIPNRIPCSPAPVGNSFLGFRKPFAPPLIDLRPEGIVNDTFLSGW